MDFGTLLAAQEVSAPSVIQSALKISCLTPLAI
jgi:hypothetical protein